MRSLLTLLFSVILTSSLGAQGWPGFSIPTKQALLAAGAAPYLGSLPIDDLPDKGEEAFVLDSVVTTYSSEGEFRRQTYTFEPLGREHFVGSTLPTVYRREHHEAKRLPSLPDFVRAWGVDWHSTAREWLKAVEGRRNFTGVYGFFAPWLFQVNTTTAAYQGGQSRHRGAHGEFTLVSETDPRYTVVVRLDLIDDAGPEVPFALHSVSIVFNPSNPTPGLHALFPATDRIVLDTEQRSALAPSAILMGQNGERHESLDADPWRNRTNEELKALSRDWGIDTREDLLAMLKTLDEGIHGKTYQDLSTVLDAHPGVEPWRLSETLRLSAARSSYLHFVAATRADLGPEGIRAWDEGRRVALARWGYAVGFLNEDETWEVVLSTWRKLAGRYKSWNDYFYHYIAGRAFWATGFEDDLNKTNRALQVWAELSWNTSGAWNLPWPGSERVTTPDHSPWDYIYDPVREAHSLFDVLEAMSFSSTKPENVKYALPRLNNANHRTPIYHQVTSARIAHFLRFSQTDEALALARQTVEERPELARAWCDLGEAALVARHHGEAARAFERAIAIDAQFYDALYGAGRLRLQASDWKGALSWLERARVATPTPEVDDDGDYFLGLVFALNRVGRFTEALPLVQALLTLYPVASVQFEAGVCFYSLGESWWPQARQAFTDAEKGGSTLPEFIRRWLEKEQATKSSG